MTLIWQTCHFNWFENNGNSKMFVFNITKTHFITFCSLAACIQIEKKEETSVTVKASG